MIQKKLPKQTETQIKHSIKQYLDFNKIWHFHLLAGLGAYPGLPDMIAIWPNTIWMIEVKSKVGKLSSKQKAFRDRCLMNGINYIVVRSVDDVADAMGLLRI